MKKIFLLFCTLSLFRIGFSQSYDHSFVKSVSYLNEDTTRSVTSISYVDAFGRPLQDIIVDGSPSGNDNVKTYTYDNMGRPDKQYLPFVNNGQNGEFVDNALNLQSQFYDGLNIPGSDIPYADVVYENSPYNRVFKQSIPGEDINTVNMTSEYVPAGGLTKWTVNGANQLVRGSTYPSNSLMKYTLKDADGKLISVYKDKSGRLLQKEEMNGTLKTRYVYDAYGRLRYVMSPEGVSRMTGSLYTPTSTFVKQYCYYYEYNSKHQLVTKQLPGKDPIYLRYDGKYRLRMTQDGVQRLTGKWMFINYDNLGRTVSTGLGVLDGQNPNIPDTISPPPSDGVTSFYTYQYYDGYGFISDPNLAFDTSSAFHQIAVSTVGSVTGSKVRVMDQSVEKWLTSVLYYDKYGRVIQSIAQNAKGGYDMVNNEYNFAGELIMSKHKHSVSGSSAKYLVYTYQYDDFGRLINVKLSQNENGSNWIIVDNLSYDETGHVKQKKIHSDDQLSYLQTVDYTYNVKGAMTGMNNPSALGDDLFAFELFYDSKPDHISNPVYQDGKISAMQWNSKNLNAVQTYGFTYDNANRLTSASFSPDNKYDMTFTYDKNGNITNLTRKGQIITQSPPSGGLGGPVQNIGYDWIDNLTYVYSGNKLQSVNDSYGSLNSQLNNDFRDNGSQTQTEYFYDVNGNMTRDNNKGITSVTYNHLNQPVEVVLSGKRTKYTYTSTGLKLKTEVYVDDKLQSETEYIGVFVYEDEKLSYINIPDGRYVIATGKYEYNLTDHLGNVRVTFTKGADGKATTIEEDHYYPFGLQMSGQHFQNTGFLNKYLYNGKEKQDQTGYYDYGFRQLDPQLGRWHVVDALAEYAMSESPYAYVGNNPISYYDALGLLKMSAMEAIDYLLNTDHGGTWTNTGGGGGNAEVFKDDKEALQAGVDYNNYFNSWEYTMFPEGAKVGKNNPKKTNVINNFTGRRMWGNGYGLYSTRADALKAAPYSLIPKSPISVWDGKDNDPIIGNWDGNPTEESKNTAWFLRNSPFLSLFPLVPNPFLRSCAISVDIGASGAGQEGDGGLIFVLAGKDRGTLKEYGEVAYGAGTELGPGAEITNYYLIEGDVNTLKLSDFEGIRRKIYGGGTLYGASSVGAAVSWAVPGENKLIQGLSVQMGIGPSLVGIIYGGYNYGRVNIKN